MFNNKFYIQIAGVAMGSPLGLALDNVFMCSFENKWLKHCPHSLKPIFYRRYVMIYLYCFPHSIKQNSLKGIYSPNIFR